MRPISIRFDTRVSAAIRFRSDDRPFPSTRALTALLGIQHHAEMADDGHWRDHCRADTNAADSWRNLAQVCCFADPQNLGFLGIKLQALVSTLTSVAQSSRADTISGTLSGRPRLKPCMSSANVWYHSLLRMRLTSSAYSRNCSGPRTEPCGWLRYTKMQSGSIGFTGANTDNLASAAEEIGQPVKCWTVDAEHS